MRVSCLRGSGVQGLVVVSFKCNGGLLRGGRKEIVAMNEKWAEISVTLKSGFPVSSLPT